MNQIGIHAFDKITDISWELEILFLNLISALTWKKYMGPIHLYCNTEYLNDLKKYDIDLVYDSINTDILDNKPNDIDYKQYWAFSKFLVMKTLKAPFTLIDTDLYINDKLEFDKNLSVIMYHKENFAIEYDKNIYIDFDNLLPPYIKEMNLDKNILPTNTAILHISNDEFLKEWIDLSTDIAKYNTDYFVDHPASKICFIEQRLLPILLERNNLKYDTIVRPIYQTHLSEIQDGSEWIPHLQLICLIDPVESKKFMDIKHLWGIKKLFDNFELRNKVMNIILNDFEKHKSEIKIFEKIFEKIYQKISKKYKREI